MSITPYIGVDGLPRGYPSKPSCVCTGFALRAVFPSAASCTGPSQNGRARGRRKAMPSKSILCRISLPVRREFEGHGLNRYSCKAQRTCSGITGKIKGLFSFPTCGLLPRRCKRILLRFRHRPWCLVRVLRKTERPEGAVLAGTQFNFLWLEANTIQAFLPDCLQQLGFRGTHGHHLAFRIASTAIFIALGVRISRSVGRVVYFLPHEDGLEFHHAGLSFLSKRSSRS